MDDSEIEINKRVKVAQCEKLNKYDMYVINIEDRIDRYNYVTDMMKSQNVFNVNYFSAFKCKPGYIGCGLSHRSLIKYAKINNLPYIIVMEDDNSFRIGWEEIDDIMKWLTDNLSDWEIFNGNPTLWDIRHNTEKLIKYPSTNNKLCYVNFGQTTNFIIYNKSSYDTMLNYQLNYQIDVYIPKMFLQLVPLKFISSQQCFFSDVCNMVPDTVAYADCFNFGESTIQNHVITPTIPTIGIYCSFVNTSVQYYENFIKNMETYFLPQYKKFYYVVTDKHDITILNNRTFFYFIEKIFRSPHESLYQFKRILCFCQSDIEKSSVIYHLNYDAKCMDVVNSDVLPDDTGYVFTIHNGLIDKPYHSLTYETNTLSSAYIPYIESREYFYFGSRFYGAQRINFIEMCTHLAKNIESDESLTSIIAVWYDESHLNHFCNIILNNKFKKLGIEYHVQKYDNLNNGNAKIIYLSTN